MTGLVSRAGFVKPRYAPSAKGSGPHFIALGVKSGEVQDLALNRGRAPGIGIGT
jgi:hypothetical protein